MVPRLTADERRDDVLVAAVVELARGGYVGTTTEAIAGRAGISQPYLFRLFGTKKALFLAVLEMVQNRIVRTFETAAEGLDGVDALCAMGEAYLELLTERDLLRVQLHAFAAAADDPDIGEATRGQFRRLWLLVEELTGLHGEQIKPFFATGMLLNIFASIDLLSVDEAWVAACIPDPETMRAWVAAVG